MLFHSKSVYIKVNIFMYNPYIWRCVTLFKKKTFLLQLISLKGSLQDIKGLDLVIHIYVHVEWMNLGLWT